MINNYKIEKSNNYNIIKNCLELVKNHNNKNDKKINIYWANNTKRIRNKININKNYLYNVFIDHNFITNKGMLLETIGNNVFDYIPISFDIDLKDINVNKKIDLFLKYYNKKDITNYNFDINKYKYKQEYKNNIDYSIYNNYYNKYISNENKNIWIIKQIGCNRGENIFIFNDLKYLKEYINNLYLLNNFKEDSTNIKEKQKNNFIIQKYIENPLLIHNKKFDIRVWGLIDQNKNIYYYNNGYLRLSSYDFSLDNFDKKEIHLTNNIIQKKTIEYNKDYNTILYNDFLTYIIKHYDNNFKIDYILSQVAKIIKIVFNKFINKIKNINSNSFQLFGFDFMIDLNYKVWLIEVNNNPSLIYNNSELEILINNMLSDLFNIIINKKDNNNNNFIKLN